MINKKIVKKITKKFLKKYIVYTDVIDYCEKQKLIGLSINKVIENLVKNGKFDYAEWFIKVKRKIEWKAFCKGENLYLT